MAFPVSGQLYCNCFYLHVIHFMIGLSWWHERSKIFNLPPPLKLWLYFYKSFSDIFALSPLIKATQNLFAVGYKFCHGSGKFLLGVPFTVTQWQWSLDCILVAISFQTEICIAALLWLIAIVACPENTLTFSSSPSDRTKGMSVNSSLLKFCICF